MGAWIETEITANNKRSIISMPKKSSYFNATKCLAADRHYALLQKKGNKKMPVFKKFKRANALTRLQDADYSELMKANELIQSYIIDKPFEATFETGNVTLYVHHLPLLNINESELDESNWDLSETAKKQVKEALAKLDEYRDAVLIAYQNECCFSKNKNVEFARELLPPWIVFPLYDSVTIGWRMGTGEVYMEIFLSFVDSLTDEQKKAYAETYPMPSYMSTNRFGFNAVNHYLRQSQ